MKCKKQDWATATGSRNRISGSCQPKTEKQNSVRDFHHLSSLIFEVKKSALFYNFKEIWTYLQIVKIVQNE